MSINTEIKKLLDDNYKVIRQEKYQTKPDNSFSMKPRLVYDGIVDEDRFDGIVYLLKEATEKGVSELSSDELKQDLIQHHQYANDLQAWDFLTTTQSRAKTDEHIKEAKNWKPLCYWTEAFGDTCKYYNDSADCGVNLSKIALVNIKKTTGEGTSKNAPLDIITTNEEYSGIIREQIKIINRHPQKISLVVCCGTFELAKKLYETDDLKVIALMCGANCFINSEGILFVEFIHPSQYGAAAKLEITFAYAKEIARELKDKGLMR